MQCVVLKTIVDATWEVLNGKYLLPFGVMATGRGITCNVIPVAVRAILLALQLFIFLVCRVVFKVVVVDTVFKFVRA